MTPIELSKLPELQQRNALLAIALGKNVEYYGGRACEKIHEHDCYPLDQQPEQDGALMWRLVCEIGRWSVYVLNAKQPSFLCEYYNKKCGFVTCTDSYDTREQALIAAYLAADPKGLIANWRKDNEPH